MRLPRNILSVLALTFIVALLTAPLHTALAREERAVGDYTVRVGWIHEPAMQGDTNGIWVRVLQGEEPVTELEGSLVAEVQFAESVRALPLTPVEGEPGVYSSVFIPIQTGDYTFHLTGTIGETTVEEAFVVGEAGIPVLLTRAEYEFPVTAHGIVQSVALPVAIGAIGLLAWNTIKGSRRPER